MADPGAPTGGRDLFYLFNTYADKLRFVVDIDFRVATDYLYLAVKLVDRSGVAPEMTHTRVLFALRTSQRNTMSFMSPSSSWYDDASGLLLVNATYSAAGDGWYVITTSPSNNSTTMMLDARRFESEKNVGIAFAVETADSELRWDADPSRRSPFFGINSGSYASGFDSFAPYAVVNLTATNICAVFGPFLPPAAAPTSNITRALIENTTTVVNVTVDTYNVSGWKDYNEAAVQIIVAGVRLSSINFTLSDQAWLMSPIYCLFNITDISIYSMATTVNMSASTINKAFNNNLSMLFNSTEMTALTNSALTNSSSNNSSGTNSSGSSNSSGSMIFALVTFTIRVPTVADSMLMGARIANNTNAISGAVTRGMSMQSTVSFVQGVDNVAVGVVGYQAWIRTPRLLRRSSTPAPAPPPPPVFTDSSSRLSSGLVLCVVLLVSFINVV